MKDIEYAISDIRHSIAYKNTDVSLRKLNITTVPDEIKEHPKLENLSLWRCELTEIPELIRSLPRLKSLSVSECRLVALPEWLPEVKSLKRLDFSHNQITSIPKTYGEFQKLDSFDLRCNQLIGFPQQLCNLKTLQSLDVSGNNLGSLPDSILILGKLEELFAANTSLNCLSAALLEMKSLRTLELRENPLLKLPAELREVGGSPAKKVLRYYFTHVVPLLKGAAACKGGPLPHEDIDPYEKIREAQTEAGRWPTQRLIARITNWQNLCKFVVESATRDTVEIRFITLPEDLDSFVGYVDKLCSDVIGQHFGCFGEYVNAAKESGEPLAADVAELIAGVDLESERAGFELLKRSLVRDMKLTLWWD